MKKQLQVLTICITYIVLFSGFAFKTKSKTVYAYVTSLEVLKNAPRNVYVDLYTNIVEVRCNHGHNEVERQFLEYYHAEIGTSKRELVANTTSAWLYNSYDEALAKRRSDMAKYSTKEKRILKNFYLTCE
jgi:hypothetical protein